MDSAPTVKKTARARATLFFGRSAGNSYSIERLAQTSAVSHEASEKSWFTRCSCRCQETCTLFHPHAVQGRTEVAESLSYARACHLRIVLPPSPGSSRGGSLV